MTSSHHGPYAQGCTRATMAKTMGCNLVRGSKSLKFGLSSDCRLKFACMKMESLVIADQHAVVNTFSGLVHTARHIPKVATPEASFPSLWFTPKRKQEMKVRPAIGVKS
jgi:hypothetical protein